MQTIEDKRAKNCQYQAKWRKANLNKKKRWNRRWYKKNRKHSSEYHRNHYRDNYEQISKRTRLKRHGITIEWFEKVLAKQKNCCAICASPFLRLGDIKVDHDHKTKKARGFLCNSCNLGLGMFKDNPIFMERAAIYLKRKR